MTGQNFLSSEGINWFFDSGSCALDFCYTGSWAAADGRLDRAVETLTDPEALTAWLGALVPCSPANDRDLQDARALREAIARIARSLASEYEAPGTDIDMLNLYAATPDVPARLAGGLRQAGRTEPRAAQVLASIARDAVALFSGRTAGRLRHCAAEDCDLIYFDASRAGSRRWCSMQRCGNRDKVRRHRARLAAAKA
ncbi:CGNR zinc finger domain-containing protein [Mycetocola spongiae]|nr:CGNR zinc finger domain-containing protein [Mycetocola spongiae]